MQNQWAQGLWLWGMAASERESSDRQSCLHGQGLGLGDQETGGIMGEGRELEKKSTGE